MFLAVDISLSKKKMEDNKDAVLPALRGIEIPTKLLSEVHSQYRRAKQFTNELLAKITIIEFLGTIENILSV